MVSYLNDPLYLFPNAVPSMLRLWFSHTLNLACNHSAPAESISFVPLYSCCCIHIVDGRHSLAVGVVTPVSIYALHCAGDNLVLEEQRNYLNIFREYYMQLGEWMFKKSKRLEVLCPVPDALCAASSLA